jgi:hypothetical protein
VCDAGITEKKVSKKAFLSRYMWAFYEPGVRVPQRWRVQRVNLDWLRISEAIGKTEIQG